MMMNEKAAKTDNRGTIRMERVFLMRALATYQNGVEAANMAAQVDGLR
jgi:hypothetical protein